VVLLLLDAVEHWIWDLQHGVETRKRESGLGIYTDGILAVDARHGYACSGRHFSGRLRELKLDWTAFTFVDLGCGKGKVLLLAATLPFARIVGVEISAELVHCARHNLAHYKAADLQCKNMEVVQTDATQYELPNSPLVLYCFNSFPEPIMRAFLINLRRSLKQRDRTVYLIYVNPLFSSLIEEVNLLQKVYSGDHYVTYRHSVV
jgi:SAM-dependent methyltransferase